MIKHLINYNQFVHDISRLARATYCSSEENNDSSDFESRYDNMKLQLHQLVTKCLALDNENLFKEHECLKLLENSGNFFKIGYLSQINELLLLTRTVFEKNPEHTKDLWKEDDDHTIAYYQENKQADFPINRIELMYETDLGLNFMANAMSTKFTNFAQMIALSGTLFISLLF